VNIRFLAEADTEFREAARYYEDKAPGLGMAFVAEVHRSVSLITGQPGLGSPLGDEWRKLVLRRFAYSLIYIAVEPEIVIAAVAHHKRRPFYWAKRV